VIVPFGHDQYDNAARVEALGVARSISGHRKLAGRLATAVQETLADPGLRERARIVAQRIDNARALERACELVEGRRIIC
jgi:UDP:flavonoid glycosyltransferase YjiC (YdhE family)